MHPAIMWWKHARRAAECGSWAGCGSGGGEGHGHGGHGGHGGHEGGGGGWEAGGWEPGGDGGQFGVRRPLRFLAYKLQLSQQQVADLARILDELKTERAQAQVDGRRALTAFAESIEREAFDEAKANEAGTLRVRTAERLRDAVTGALKRIHALLDGEQRATLAYLIRTGTVTL